MKHNGRLMSWMMLTNECSSSRPPSNTQSLKFGNKKQSATCLRCFAALIPPLISNSFWSSRSYGQTWAGSVLWCSDLNWGVVRLVGQGQNRLGKVQRWGSNWKKTIPLYIWFVWALQRHDSTSFAPFNECPKDPIPTALIRIPSIFNTLHCQIILGLLEGFPRNKTTAYLVIPRGPLGYFYLFFTWQISSDTPNNYEQRHLWFLVWWKSPSV